MSKDLHTWQHIDALSCELITKLGANNYDAILAVTRGGMTPACLLSERLDVRNVLTAGVMFYTDVGETLNEPRFLQFPSDALLHGKSILIVDDIWDSGKTAMAVKQRVLEAGGHPKVAVLHFKPKNNAFPNEQPDFYASETDAWVVYPWEVACS